MHTIKERLAYALTGESVIRALMRAKATMAYKDFGEVIGYIKPGEAWDYHRHTTGIAEILTLIAAAESQGSSSEEPLDNNVIISATIREPGKGAPKFKLVRIVQLDEKQPEG